MVTDSHGVLKKERVFVGVRARSSFPEILNIVARDLMRVGAKRREWKSADLGHEGKWIDFDVGIDIFAAEKAGKKVVVASEADVAAELDGVAMVGDADG